MTTDANVQDNDAPTDAAMLREDPALVERLARATLEAHLGAARARMQRDSMPEICRCVREIAALAGRLVTRRPR